MFLGKFDHQLEERGRLSIPKKFRSHLETGAVISSGLDGCLFLFPLDQWNALMSKISSLPLTQSTARDFSRLLTYNASEVEIDRLGRILIPEFLRTHAKLTKDCVVAGSGSRIEIWSKSELDSYQSKISIHASEIAEHLKDLGI